jgi:hypothetical protein
VEFAVMQTPDGHGRLKMIKVHRPAAQGDNRARATERTRSTPSRIRVENIDAVVAGLCARGNELVGDLECYKDSYRLCYSRPRGDPAMNSNSLADPLRQLDDGGSEDRLSAVGTLDLTRRRGLFARNEEGPAGRSA